jgi:beta-glucosidase
MTLEEKIKLCEGENFWETRAFPDENIPRMFMCDGPHGLRKQEKYTDHLGVNKSRPATCFPTSATTACSWDTDLLGKIGAAIAEEAADQGVGVFLGPGANIKRNPLCGRNFEYFSEDPYLAGKLAASFIKHAQANGIGTSLKHFACNNQEFKRFQSDSKLDERTLREIYLTAFEIAVREGKPKTVMCAYNRINGKYCSDNEELLTRILRDDWGFDGLVMTDWGAMHSRISAFKAGCDLNMPGGSNYMLNETLEAVKTGELNEADINRSAQRVKKMVFEANDALKFKTFCDYDAHHILAREAAEQSAVLLKNDGNILPLRKEQTIALVGDLAVNMRYQGTGSSHINPTKIVSPYEALSAGENANAYGAFPFSENTDTADALASSTNADTTGAFHSEETVDTADVVIICAGLPAEYESEGFDREHMKLPETQARLIEDTAKRNANTVVVLFGGSPMECPWADGVKAVLYMALPGQAGGEALKNLLYGEVNPCGKLAESWPKQYNHCPSFVFYGTRDAIYREGIYVGYRHYDKTGIAPMWRFGFGLSYTQFSYSGAGLSGDTANVTVTNTGSRAGAEIIQLYVKPENTQNRPVRELKRFTKVFLNPGESREVSFTLDERCFAVWHEGWKVPKGTYTVLIGGNPDCLQSAGTIQKGGEEIKLPAPWEKLVHRLYIPQKGKFTMDDSVTDMKEHSLVMKLMYLGIKRTISKGAKPGTALYRMMMESSAGSPLRSMAISGGIKTGLFKGLLAMANGKFFLGLKILIKGG